MSHHYNPSVELRPNLEVQTDPLNLKFAAGSVGIAALTIRNPGPKAVHNLRFSPNFIMRMSLSPRLPPIMAPGGEYHGTLTLSVPSDAPIGIYQWEARLKGSYEA